MNNMEDVISLVNTNRGKGVRKQSLERMQRLMEKVGNPQESLSFIHVAGTNGKGSTSAYLYSILQKAGYKTGFFTSPHLEVINERIQINGARISDEAFIRLSAYVEPFVYEVEKELGETLFSFEILTAVAFLYFAEQESEIVILEAGIGGRLDATNVIPTPEVAILTSIGMDHVATLGDTLEKITTEKAGIIKEKGQVIVYPMNETIQSLLQKKAEEVDAEITAVREDAIIFLQQSLSEQSFTYHSRKNVVIQMMGNHQIVNACLAIEAVECLIKKGYNISEEAIREGLKQTKWPGRMEKIVDHPLVILEGAHNEQGIKMLAQTLDSLLPNQKVTFIIGMMADKEYMKMIHSLKDKAEKFFFISPDPYRGFNPEVVSEQVKEEGISANAFHSTEEIKEYIEKIARKDEVIIVCGSLYLVGDMRKQFKVSAKK